MRRVALWQDSSILSHRRRVIRHPVMAINWNRSIRQFHRWVSIVFTLTVVANFVALGTGSGMPPPWVTYAPLPPLALLLATGLVLFALPYVAARPAPARQRSLRARRRWRRRKATPATATT
jgi:hypothetical protein